MPARRLAPVGEMRTDIVREIAFFAKSRFDPVVTKVVLLERKRGTSPTAREGSVVIRAGALAGGRANALPTQFSDTTFDPDQESQSL